MPPRGDGVLFRRKDEGVCREVLVHSGGKARERQRWRALRRGERLWSSVFVRSGDDVFQSVDGVSQWSTGMVMGKHVR